MKLLNYSKVGEVLKQPTSFLWVEFILHYVCKLEQNELRKDYKQANQKDGSII